MVNVCSEHLVPQVGHRIVLVHVIGPAVGVCACKQEEQAAMLNHSVSSPRSIDDFVVDIRILVQTLPFLALLVIHVLL